VGELASRRVVLRRVGQRLGRFVGLLLLLHVGIECLSEEWCEVSCRLYLSTYPIEWQGCRRRQTSRTKSNKLLDARPRDPNHCQKTGYEVTR
jgi:hypothetical protein